VSELSPEERDVLLSTFLASYNAQHGTAYSFESDGPAGRDFDYVCADPARPREPLKIQHTRAWTDDNNEMRHPADVNKFVVRVIKRRLEEAGVLDYHVSIRVVGLPASKADKYNLVETVWEAVAYAINRDDPAGTVRRRLEFNDHDVASYFDPIRAFIKDLEITKTEPPEGTPAQVFWSPTVNVAGVVDGTFRFKESLGKKEGVYRGTSGDLVLIVDYEVMPYAEEYDVDAIKAWVAARGAAFKEIWIVSRWLPPSAHRVWVGT